jgi:DNA-binding transcriptional regulator YiaG
MPNVNAVLAQEITRLSKRVVKSSTQSTRKLVTQHRRDLAALKRQMATILKTLSFLEALEKKRVASQPVPQEMGVVRFRADGLKSHRAKLGLSAKDYGHLVGVAGITVYHWESGKSKPRKAQVAKLAAVRGIGKREAQKRLELLGVSTGGTRRGSYSQTAEDFITSLVKSRKATTTGDINMAWRKSGRPAKADNTLSKMVAAKTLKRVKVKGVRGSRYSVA